MLKTLNEDILIKPQPQNLDQTSASKFRPALSNHHHQPESPPSSLQSISQSVSKLLTRVDKAMIRLGSDKKQ